MSAPINPPFYKEVELSAQQLSQLQIKEGISDRPEYADSVFKVIELYDRVQPKYIYDDQVSTWDKTNFRYHVTRYPAADHQPPALGETVTLTANQISPLMIDQQGKSRRADLQGYRFATTFLGQGRYRLTTIGTPSEV